MITTVATEKSVSYRRNRDYTEQFDWTYDLNCDLYNCFTKAKENPAIGYMKRMKQNWDIIHHEFSHLSHKNYVIKLVELSRTKLSWRPNFQ